VPNGSHERSHPLRVTVPFDAKAAINAMRPRLNGTIVVVEEGGPTIYIDCADVRDATLIKCAHYLAILSD
jgi:hypothetical protein